MSSLPGSNTNQVGTQYAAKKRRRPQPKKEKDAQQEGKTNPSKRHRDRLNHELDHLAKLIPFPEEVLNKLDKLSILRLAVSYFRNKNYHAGSLEGNQIEPGIGHGQLVPKDPLPVETESMLSLMALHGFIIIVTQDYNIFHVTDTVQDYLGFPQCDVMNQSMLDLIHAEDRYIFMRHMQLNPKQAAPEPVQEGDPPAVPEYSKYGFSPEMFKELSDKGMLHRSFICRLRCLLDNSSGFLALHFTGHLRLVPGQNRRGEGNVLLPPETGLFLLASPLHTPSILEIRTKNFIFRTKHKLDYTPLGIDAKGKIVLGYNEQQLRQRSGYEFIHSADMMHCADAHTKLMNKGESGLTVFRLLHKNNKWLWVTASARVVFRNGRPDYIISTHRPIPDQEGVDHMKKRSEAFRFDFTGDAILYGEVNPTGTRGGPEKNVLNEGLELQEPPAAKKMKISNGSESSSPDSIDRKTLYGAQSMQEMQIYSGNQSANLFAKSGLIAEALKLEPYEAALFDENNSLIHDSDIHFYPIGNEVPQDQTFVPSNMSFEDAIRHQYQAPTKYNEMINQEPPPLSHEPLDKKITYMNQSSNSSFKSMKRPYPYEKSDSGSPMSCNFSNSPSSEQWSPQCHSIGKTMPKSEMVPITPQPFPSYNNNEMNCNKGPSPLQRSIIFKNPNGRSQHQLNVDNSANLNQPLEMDNTPQLNFAQNPNVFSSMSIKSTYTSQQQQNNIQNNHTQQQDKHYNNEIPLPANSNDYSYVGQQDNEIQFDLNKIAAEFQTNDPVGTLQTYLHKNPHHAMAISTGLIPDQQMANLNPDKVNAFMPSCKYQQNSIQEDQIQSNRNHHPIAQKDIFYPFANQLSDGSVVSPSISVTSQKTTDSDLNPMSETMDNQVNNLYNEIDFLQQN